MENLDEAVGGVRVTRSLRKRLNSVDTESSSRPGTPCMSKLQTVPETATPLRVTRMSRRRSTTTPVKTTLTATKAFGSTTNINEINSPAKMRTRNTSVTVSEEDLIESHVRASIKQLQFDTLQEEDIRRSNDNDKSNSKGRRSVGRPRKPGPKSKTKLHNDSDSELELSDLNLDGNNHESNRINKSNQKIGAEECTIKHESTNKNPNDKSTSDVKEKELLNISKENVSDSNNSNNTSVLQTSVSPLAPSNKGDNSSIIITEVVQLKPLTPATIAELAKSPAKGNSAENSKSVTFNVSEDEKYKNTYPKTPLLIKTKSYTDQDQSRDIIEKSSIIDGELFTSSHHTIPELDAIEKAEAEVKCIPEPHSVLKESVDNNDTTTNDISQVNGDYAETMLGVENTPNKTLKALKFAQSSTPIVDPIIMQKAGLKNSLNGEKDHSIAAEAEQMRAIELDLSEMLLRSGKRYTPSPTSSPKSLSKHNTPPGNSTNISIRKPDTTPNKNDEKQREHNSFEINQRPESGLMYNKTTPRKEESVSNANLATAQHNDNAEHKIHDSSVEIRQSNTCGDIGMESPGNISVQKMNVSIVESPKSLSSSVCVSTKKTSDKIDCIKAEITSPKDTKPEQITIKYHTPPENGAKEQRRGEENVEEEAEVEHYDDDQVEEEEEEELDEDEKPYAKHSFITNEAIEVGDDYKSGDSMDEEERREMEENQIPEAAESIGSNDTEEQEEEDDEEGINDEYEVDSFIASDSVSDGDIMLQYSDDDEHLESNKGKTVYRRIHAISSSSESANSENVTNEKEESNKNSALVMEVTRMIDDSSDDADDVVHVSNVQQQNAAADNLLNDKQLNLSAVAKDSLENMQKSNLDKSEANNSASQLHETQKQEKQSEQILNGSANMVLNVTDLEEGEMSNVNISKSSAKKSSFTTEITATISADEDTVQPNGSTRKSYDDHKNGDVEELKESYGKKCKNVLSQSLQLQRIAMYDRSSDEMQIDVNTKKHRRHSTQISNNYDRQVIGLKAKTECLNLSQFHCSGGTSPAEHKRPDIFENVSVKQKQRRRSSISRYGTSIGVSAEQTVEKPAQNQEDFERASDDYGTICNGDTYQNAESTENQWIGDNQQQFDKLSNMDKVTKYLDSMKRQSLVIPSEYNQNLDAEENKLAHETSSFFCGATSASQSFAEAITNKFQQEERLSKSFSGHSMDENNSRSPLKENKLSKDNANNSLQRILGRCDEILAAANRAKFEEKINNKRSKNKTPKKLKAMRKVATNSTADEDEESPDEPLIKQEKKKKVPKAVIEHALKASANLLLKRSQMKDKLLETVKEEQLQSKHLPQDVIDAICSPSIKAEKKQSSEEDEEKYCARVGMHKMKTSAGIIVEAPATPKKKIKSEIHKFELPSGIMCEEPLTPDRKSSKSGVFRESPITPRTLGFKVRQILTAGQDQPPSLTQKHQRQRKLKRKMVEPTNTLPQPQWTQSGTFIEEVLPTSHTIAHSGATQFLLSTLSSEDSVAKRRKRKRIVPSKSSVSNALKFKRDALCRADIPRESSRELLQRKERSYAYSRF